MYAIWILQLDAKHFVVTWLRAAVPYLSIPVYFSPFYSCFCLHKRMFYSVGYVISKSLFLGFFCSNGNCTRRMWILYWHRLSTDARSLRGYKLAADISLDWVQYNINKLFFLVLNDRVVVGFISYLRPPYFFKRKQILSLEKYKHMWFKMCFQYNS